MAATLTRFSPGDVKGSSTARHAPALGLGIVLLAFGLRLILLGDQNVWWDEAFSLHLVREPLVTMLRDAAHDTHPPLYYLLLKPWLALGGDTEFVARLLSVFAGTAAVAAVFAAGRLIAGLPGAVVAGAVLAVSRFAVWWSQETRMYALAVAFVAVATWAAIRFVRSGQRRSVVFYAATAALALSTVYISGAAIAGLAIGAGLALLLGGRYRDLAWWVAGQAAAALAVAPWLVVQLRSTPTWSAGGESTTAETVLRSYLVVLPTGVGGDLERWRIVGLTLIALAAVGGLAAIVARRFTPVMPVIATLLATPLVIWLSLLPRGTYYQPPFSVRYFVVATPAFAVLLGAVPLLASLRTGTSKAGAAPAPTRDNRRRAPSLVPLVAGGLTLFAALLTAASLPSYFAPRHRVDDYASMALALAIHREPGDAVLLVSGDRAPLWEHAVRRIQPPIEWTGAPWQQPADERSVRDEVDGATSGADRVWLVAIDSQLLDPQDLVRQELARRYAVLFDERFGPNRLTLFAPPGAALGATLPNVMTRRDEGPPIASELPVNEVRPGEEVVLTLLVRGPLTAEQYIELQGQDAEGRGMIIERRPLRDFVPDRLQDADLVRVPYRIAAHRFTPGGSYHAVLHVADQAIPLGTIRVAGTDAIPTVASDADDVGAWVDDRLGPGTLVLARSGVARADCDGTRGMRVDLGLRLETPLTRPYTLFVQLVGSTPNPATGNPVWSQRDGPPLAGELPVTQFPMDGRVVLEQVCLPLPADLPTGQYQIITGWYDAATGERLPFEWPAGRDDHAVIWTGTDFP